MKIVGGCLNSLSVFYVYCYIMLMSKENNNFNVQFLSRLVIDMLIISISRQIF